MNPSDFIQTLVDDKNIKTLQDGMSCVIFSYNSGYDVISFMYNPDIVYFFGTYELQLKLPTTPFTDDLYFQYITVYDIGGLSIDDLNKLITVRSRINK